MPNQPQNELTCLERNIVLHLALHQSISLLIIPNFVNAQCTEMPLQTKPRKALASTGIFNMLIDKNEANNA